MSENVFSTPGGAAVTVGNLNGFFKDTWESQLGVLIPDGVKVLTKFAFISKEKTPGNLFHVPVVLGLEHGITYSSDTEDYVALNAAVAGSIKDATVRGAPMILRSILGYSAASRAAAGTQAAFMDATKFLVANMLRSITKKLELEMLYGKVGFGIVAGDASLVNGVALGAGNGGLVDVGGKATLHIADKEWASGIWAGAENMPIDFVVDGGTTVHGTANITKVDLSAKMITLDVAAASLAAVVATDVIFPKGAIGKSFRGIHSILAGTSADLFGIDSSIYTLFKANVYDAGDAALSFNKLTLAAARAVEKGLEGPLWVLINPRTWANLMNDQAALRMYDQSYGSEKVEVGAKSIKFHSQNGELEIEPSIYVKEGYAYMLSTQDWSRVGSTDVTFKRPGQGDQFFRDMEQYSGYELRSFTDQAIFCSAPGRNVLITGIKNSNV